MKRIASLSTIVLLLATMVVPSLVAADRDDRRQPHMYAAMEHLRAARAELERAEHNKGGHRARAIALVDDAIGQVKMGIEVGEHERR